jgi:hypothetical protein
MFFKFEEKIYTNWNDLCDAVMQSHPELGDDSLVDFIDDNAEEISWNELTEDEQEQVQEDYMEQQELERDIMLEQQEYEDFEGCLWDDMEYI